MTGPKGKQLGRAPALRPADTRRVGSRGFNRRLGKARASAARKHPHGRRAPIGWSPSQHLRGIPLAAWVCAVVAFSNAACWSIITPPFEAPDEPEHVGYVKQLAETGQLPRGYGRLSFEESVALEDVLATTMPEQPEIQAVSTRAQHQTLERELARVAKLPRDGSEGGGVGVAASQPPLYYVLESIPYLLASGGTLLDRIEMMRLFSALMGGLTALFAFLFVRETLPRHSWAWTVGGLGVALAPLLGFMSGVVNPDSMLIAVTAALFYRLACGFRRGVGQVDLMILGVLIAAGLMTKLNFVGIAPGALLGLAALSVRAARAEGRAGYRYLAVGLGLALSPVALYSVGHVASGSSALRIVASAGRVTHGSLLSEASYIWQLYLPRLPGMNVDFAGVSTSLQVWFKGYVGLYGWLDTAFPAWVYAVALAPAGLIACLCIRAVAISFGALRSRALEFCTYGLICLGLMLLVGGGSYAQFPAADAEYGQFRYFLPLIPLLGLVLALAARGVGRRWGPSVGVLIIVLFLAHDVFSQLQAVARYYG